MISKSSNSESWVASEVRRQRQHAIANTDHAVSSHWGHSRSDGDKRDRLYDLLTTIRNFCRLMGVPANTDIRIAGCAEVGTACAGFYDSPDSFLRPFVLIDEGVFERCNVSDCMDVAVGLAIHEAMHVLQTRQAYRRLAEQERDQRLNFLENLIEDWRIEELCRQEFPGYTDYLYKLRRVLIVDQSLSQSMHSWDRLPDVDKIMAIVVAYIRAPQLLIDFPALQAWQDLRDRNIYQYLRKHLPRPPISEEEVELMALRLLHLIDDYRNLSLQHLADNDKITPETIERIKLQEKANAIDHALGQLHDPLVRRRFSPADIQAAQVMDDSVRKGSSEATVARINELDRTKDKANVKRSLENDTRLPEQHIPPVYRGQFSFERFPSQPFGMLLYDRAHHRVKGNIARMKQAFRVEQGGTGQATHRTNGKLDRKRLYRAPFDPTIFAQITNEEPANVLVALLIDASGSMAKDDRYFRAMDVAVMFNEAFINHPFIKLQTYSHTSSGSRCQLYYHGSASPNSRLSIGSIEPKYSNYDYQAIWGVVSHLESQSKLFPRRLLLSVSDGLPCAPLEDGGTAVTATRKAVDDVRRIGWTIFGIGIGDVFAEEVYGKRWTLRLPNEAALPQNIASLLVKLIRRYHH